MRTDAAICSATSAGSAVHGPGRLFDRAVVVIPAHNEADHLASSVKAVLAAAACLPLPVTVIVVLAIAGSRMIERPADGPSWPTSRVVVAITVAGILDVLGLIAFATGLESAPTWMVSLAASFGPAVTILVAVALLGERLRPIQWLGLAGILTGMVAIAIP